MVVKHSNVRFKLWQDFTIQADPRWDKTAEAVVETALQATYLKRSHTCCFKFSSGLL